VTARAKVALIVDHDRAVAMEIWPRISAQAEGHQKPRRSLTMIAVTRPGVITLLMMRMLFTPLGTP
jgi:hypothetical protein